MPQKRRSQSWAEVKQSGNECFKTGQYGEAVSLYSQAINLLEKSGQKKPEDLSILYSNRAASYLKNGNCSECIKDCSVGVGFPAQGIGSNVTVGNFSVNRHNIELYEFSHSYSSQ